MCRSCKIIRYYSFLKYRIGGYFQLLYNFANFGNWDRFRENCNIEYVFFAHVIACPRIDSTCTYIHMVAWACKLGQAHFAKILFLKSISLHFREI